MKEKLTYLSMTAAFLRAKWRQIRRNYWSSPSSSFPSPAKWRRSRCPGLGSAHFAWLEMRQSETEFFSVRWATWKKPTTIKSLFNKQMHRTSMGLPPCRGSSEDWKRKTIQRNTPFYCQYLETTRPVASPHHERRVLRTRCGSTLESFSSPDWLHTKAVGQS